MQQYEIEIIDYGQGTFHHSTLSTLTGLTYDEVDPVIKSIGKERWGGQAYIKALQQLGFNTNKRFIKFDPNTPYPCILRCAFKGGWYLFYYCGGTIYDAYANAFSIDDKTQVLNMRGSYFLKQYNLKITSMLEVWI